MILAPEGTVLDTLPAISTAAADWARTWLVDQESPAATKNGAAKKGKSRETWNGHDWYVSFGEFPEGRQWADAVKYGFVSAGGGEWYSNTLKDLPVGARVFAYIPKAGYVGVGTVLAEAQRFDVATVQIDGTERRLADLPMVGNYRHDGDGADEYAEWAVPVEWTHAVPREKCFRKKGVFSSTHSACKLRQSFTIEQVTAAFGIEN